MKGLTHDQARRLAHAAVDRRLNSRERTALEAHLAGCARCRAEAAEINWLQAAILRALRHRWAAPHRSAVEVAARVRNRLRLNTGRKIVAGLAQVVVRLGALAMVMGLAFGVAGQWRTAEPGSSAEPMITTSNHSNPLSFELQAEGDGSMYAVSSAGEAEPWPRPTHRPYDPRDTLY